MPNDNKHQSIEDLISASQGNIPEDEGSALSKFSEKEKEIKIKELERSVRGAAENQGLPYISLKGFPLSPEALILMSEEKAQKLQAVCFFYDGKNVRVGALQATDAVKKTLEELEAKYYASGELYLISKESLDYALKLYKSIPKIRQIEKGVKIGQAELEKYNNQFESFGALKEKIEQAGISDLVVMMIAAASQAKASDIHIEAEEKEIKLRFRIDGVLHDIADIEKEKWEKIISRIKLLAGVKINITDKPQDGRISIHLDNDSRLDIRASFLPTAYGESVVMRLLDSKSVGLSFEELGIRERDFERLKTQVERPNGMILTTGPTGSGKTTTLYAILKKLNNQETKIITVEDPIEYQLEGINQSQTGKNYGFAQALRSIVRQDPDVIMVGEIRDLETAETAIQSALTGHLVLSTIHTNDAAGTVPRFLSMGVKPFLLAPALNAMIGQRLVRKICPNCKEEIELDVDTMGKVKKLLEALPEDEKKDVNFDNLKFYKGGGCEACQGIGFSGRIGIYEIMTMNGEIEKLILSGQVSEYDMQENARKNGMISMAQDGILKALSGITSIDEVFRVAESA